MLSQTTSKLPSAPEASELPPPSYEESQQEWESKLSSEDKEKYRQYVEKLKLPEHEQQKQELLKKKQEIKQKHPDLYPIGDAIYLDAFDIWWLSRLSAHSAYLQIQFTSSMIKTLAEIAPSVGHGIVQFGSGVVRGVGQVALGGSGGGSGGGDCGEAGIIIGIIAAGIAIATSSLIAASYALKKTYNSIKNIVHGEKVGRSVVRVGATAGGACAGAIKGAAIGAALGTTTFPGLGTAAGAIIGGICGACMGAGIGAFVSKYACKFVSWIRNRNSTTVISKTNPEKYTLAKTIEDNLKKQGVSNTCSMLTVLRNQKNNEAGCAGSIPGTDASKAKDDYNGLLKAIKKGGVDVIKGVIVDNTIFRWNDKQQLWSKTQLLDSESDKLPLLVSSK